MFKVSVIVPAYNAEKTIKRTIDSLIAQTLKEIEIIVVNDGSVDNTLNILNEYCAKYPNNIFVYSQENKGVACARNLGLSKVHGEYFAFLDSDDYVSNDMAFKMYEKAQREELDVLVAGYYFTRNNNEEQRFEPTYQNNKEMMIDVYTVLWNKLFKTSFIKSLNIALPNTTRFEDCSYIYQMIPFISKVGHIDQCFTHYVQNNNSLVHTYDLKTTQVVGVWNDLFVYYKEKNLFEEYYDELEYCAIHYMLGQPFKYCSKIKDKTDKESAINMLWTCLNNNFPNWHSNKYLYMNKSKNNMFFRLVNKNNYRLFSKFLGLRK